MWEGCHFWSKPEQGRSLFHTLKGVFAKIERGYRLTAKNKRFWSLLILLLSMTIVCNIWMICLELNGLFYNPSWMLQLSEFVWTQRSSVWVVLTNFLLIDATDSSKICSDQKRLFFAVSLYPPSFFANTPLKKGYFR